MLCTRRTKQGLSLDLELASREALDDHCLWESDAGSPLRMDRLAADIPSATNPGQTLPDTPATESGLPLAADWTDQTSALVAQLASELSSRDPCWGVIAAGLDRAALPVQRCRKSLARFLNDRIAAAAGYDTLWTVPNRKLVAVYPRIILPTYETKTRWDVLMAIDASGSVPESFIATAMAFARQRPPRTHITVISFDTVWYECDPQAGVVKGGGGTRAQAVEDYIQQRASRDPHCVFVLTDGSTPAPQPQRPERWIWLLPPWGSTNALPKGSRAEFFEADEIPARLLHA